MKFQLYFYVIKIYKHLPITKIEKNAKIIYDKCKKRGICDE